MAVPKLNLDDPEAFLDLFLGILDFAGFPYLSRRQQATAADFGGERGARDWIQEQIRDRVRNPE